MKQLSSSINVLLVTFLGNEYRRFSQITSAGAGAFLIIKTFYLYATNGSTAQPKKKYLIIFL